MKIAVALQIVGSVALIAGAVLAVNVWAGVACFGVIALLFGEALERR